MKSKKHSVLISGLRYASKTGTIRGKSPKEDLISAKNLTVVLPDQQFKGREVNA